MNSMTPVHARCRATTFLIRRADSVTAVAVAIRTDRTANSSNSISMLRSFFLLISDEFLQAAHFRFAQHLGIDHPADEFFNGALTEPVDDLTHRSSCQAARPFRRSIHIGAPLALMPQ